MSPELAQELLKALGSGSSTVAGTWVRAQCVLAPWLHKSGKDTSPSFGIHCEEGKPPHFHCFTCESGSLEQLLQIIEFRNQQSPGKFHGDLAKAREIIENAELELPVLPGYDEFGQGKKRLFEELPSYYLESFVPVSMAPRAIGYCAVRGITEDEQLKFDLRYDPDKDMLLFPYRDVFGRFAGIRGRRVTLPGENKWGVGHHDYVWNDINNSGMVFYNEQVLNLPGPVVIVEGQIDTLKVARLYPKTMGNLTAKPVAEKAAKLVHADGVVLLMDGDGPGRMATEKWIKLLTFLGVKVLPLYLPYDEQQGLKTDPDSYGHEQLKKLFTDCGLIS